MGSLRANLKKLIVPAALIAASAGILHLAETSPGFATYYARNIYPYLVRAIGGASDLFPFALTEVLLYLLSAAAIIYVIRHLFRPAALALTALTAVSVCFFIYTVNCGINYRAETFAMASALSDTDHDTGELAALCGLLADEVNANVSACSGVDAGSKENGGTDLSRKNEWRELSQEAMIKLGEDYAVLSGYYPRPKPVMFSYILSVQQVTGVYSPFAIEALYNRSMPDYNIPHTMCHELSHLKGFMREDEANFIAFLACIGSDERAFKYSGYLTGFVYASNALAGADPESHAGVYSRLCEAAKADLAANNAYWAAYEGTVSEVQDKVNDAYLKSNGQPLGILTYDSFTELMLDYYFPE